MFGFAIWSDARQKRNVLVVLSSLKDAELHDQATKWLTGRLSNKKLRVQKAALFGSVVHDHYPTSDVDIVVLFTASSDGQITKIGRQIKGPISNEFRLKFGHSLHVQLFHPIETDRWAAFLTTAGKHEILPLDNA
jgi:predicted nucleotidyltransferase